MEVKEVEKMVREVLSVPGFVPLKITQRSTSSEEDSFFTDITISEGKASSVFTIEKPLNKITEDDIFELKDVLNNELSGSSFLSRSLAKLLGWWVIFAGSLTLFGVCPICGSVGCPVGIGITGVFAGALALIKQYGKYIISRIRENFFVRSKVDEAK